MKLEQILSLVSLNELVCPPIGVPCYMPKLLAPVGVPKLLPQKNLEIGEAYLPRIS